MKFRLKAIGLTVAVAVVLTACGGGGGGSTTTSATPSTLGGTAAVGFPIIGAVVHVTCASGSALISQPTSATGAWQVTLSGQTFPCAAEATGGTINNVVNTTAYHSIALNSGILNVTSLTDLVVANMVQSATLSSWFTALISSALAQIDAAKITTAMNLVQTQLSLVQLGTTIDPMTSSFTPAAGSVLDDTLTALRIALANASLTHASLLTDVSAGASFKAPSGFATSIVNAYLGTTSGATTAAGGSTNTGTNSTTGLASNGTPSFVRANCSLIKPDANTYIGCAGNAVANFTSLSMVDATDGQTCTASYSNGTLTVTKGSLTIAALLNREMFDGLTTWGSGTSETLATLVPFTMNSGTATVVVSSTTIKWNAAGVIKNIAGTASTANLTAGSSVDQKLSCTQP